MYYVHTLCSAPVLIEFSPRGGELTQMVLVWPLSSLWWWATPLLKVVSQCSGCFSLHFTLRCNCHPPLFIQFCMYIYMYMYLQQSWFCARVKWDQPSRPNFHWQEWLLPTVPLCCRVCCSLIWELGSRGPSTNEFGGTLTVCILCAGLPCQCLDQAHVGGIQTTCSGVG